MRFVIPLGILLVFLLGTGELSAQPVKPGPGAAEDFFEKEVRPLLVEKCAECHGRPFSLSLTLPPLGIVVFKRDFAVHVGGVS